MKFYVTSRCLTHGVETRSLTKHGPNVYYNDKNDGSWGDEYFYSKHVFECYDDALADCLQQIDGAIKLKEQQIAELRNLRNRETE